MRGDKKINGISDTQLPQSAEQWALCVVTGNSLSCSKEYRRATASQADSFTIILCTRWDSKTHQTNVWKIIMLVFSHQWLSNHPLLEIHKFWDYCELCKWTRLFKFILTCKTQYTLILTNKYCKALNVPIYYMNNSYHAYRYYMNNTYTIYIIHIKEYSEYYVLFIVIIITG